MPQLQSPNYFELYKTYTSGSEAPALFHDWVAMSTLASTIGRKCWLDMGYFKLYPNMYIVLVGPPATMKSTAMNIGAKLAKKAEVVKYSGDSVTREQLIRDLACSLDNYPKADGTGMVLHSSFTIQASELEVFLRQKDRDMIKFLTDVYDAPDSWEYRTKTQGTDTVQGPCVNMLSGCTPEDIPEIFDEGSIGTGLTSRMMFVYAPQPGAPVPFPILTPEQLQAREALISVLQERNVVNGPITLESPAKAHYIDWYLGRSRTHADSRVKGYWARKHIHVLKAAMIIAVGNGRRSITLPDLLLAHEKLENIEPGLEKAFSAVGANRQHPIMQAIIEQLSEPDAVLTYSDILAAYASRMKRNEIDMILETAIAMGKIEESTSTHPNTGREIRVFKRGPRVQQEEQHNATA